MDAAAAADFFAVVLLAAAVATVAATISPTLRPAIVDVAPQLAAAVAIGATVGSLYFSERAGFIPCELCWYQRIAMYPLAVILAIAAFRRDRGIAPYGLPLAVTGLAISAYHVQLQLFPDQASFCDVANPCGGRWVEALGWMTIPMMAGTSFALVIALTIIARLPQPDETPHDAATDTVLIDS